MPRVHRAKRVLRGVGKLAALVLVAGGIGVALGMGLATLSEDGEPSAGTGGSGEAEAQQPQTATGAVSTATATGPSATTTTATTTTAIPARFADVRVSVLDARLFTDSTPSGREEQRARVTVRIRAENSGPERATLDPATLRVGSVRIPVDPDGDQLAPLQPGADTTVTLRFALAGEATPKIVRDRRARILIAGRSLPMRIRVAGPPT